MKIKYLLATLMLLFTLTSCQEAVLDGTESSVSDTNDIKKVQVTAPNANVRAGCSTNAEVLQSAGANETFEVINQVSDWYAVKLPDNSIGFIPQKQVKPIVDDTTPIDMPPVAQRTPVQTNTSKNANKGTAKQPDNIARMDTNTNTNQNGVNNTGNNTTQGNNDAGINNTRSNDNEANTQNVNANDTQIASRSSLSAAEQQMVDLVNKSRAENNLPALKVDTALANVARTKSQDMIDNNYFSHNSPTYGSPFDMMKSFSIRYIKAGENIAGNQTVQAAHDALMKSPGHRANILSKDYTHIGIGIVEGGSYGNMFTQMFISK